MNSSNAVSTEVSDRLHRLVVLDTALAAGGGLFTITAALTVARLAMLFWLGVAVLATAAVIGSALRPLAVGNVHATVLRLAVANWTIAVVASFVATFAWPVLMLTALLPSAFAGAFVSRRELRPYVVISFMAAVIVACLGLLQDVTGLTGEVSEWVRNLVLLTLGPALTALVVWITLQNNLRLQDALDDELAARRTLALQADELRSSRRRVVAATDRERRRIERDLHDGAQSRLIAVNLALARLRNSLPPDARSASSIVDEIGREVQLAHGELRDLAHGVYPTVLTQHGLVAAVAAAADRSGVEVRLALTDVGRHHPDVEAAVYFCILEALQNASRHASATRVELQLVIVDAALVFTVIDDGIGFDEQSSTGAGLENMADRLGSVGGALRVSSQRSQGTTVSGSVPLGT